MPYIGRELDRGNYLKLDDISSSFDGSTTTFNLTNGGNAFYPGSAFSILVVLAGVVQEPEAAYQINQTQITFASAPLAGDQFFCIVLGQALGVNTPANGSVNGTQLAKPFNYDNYFYLDDANNRVGVGTATPMTPLHVEGTGRFTNVTVTGDLTVEGTTSTLDTVVTEVDKLEVLANNSTVAVAVTQSGSGDAATFEGGNVGIGTNNAGQKLHVSGGTGTNIQVQQSNGNLYLGSSGSTRFGLASGANIIQSAAADFGIGSQSGHNLIFGTNNAKRLSITDQGDFHIQWNNNNFLGSYYDADYYMGLSFGANRRELYIDNRSNDTRADIVFRTVLGQSDPTEKLRITSGGNIGIGNTDTPQSLLEVFGTSPIIRSKHSTSQKYTQINHNGTDGYLDWSSGGLIFRGASNTERLRITSGGNIGVAGATGTDYSLLDGMVINTANGSAGLLINSSSSSHNAYLGFSYGSGSGTSHADQYSAYIGRVGDNKLILGTNNTIRLNIDSSGRVGIQGDPTRALLEVRASGGSNTMLTALWGANEGTTTGSLSDNTDKAVRMGIQHYDTDALPYAFLVGSSTSSANNLTFGGGTGLMNAATEIVFRTASNTTTTTGTERLRITSAGNVGIGTDNPRAKLDAMSTGNFTVDGDTFDGVSLMIRNAGGTQGNGNYGSAIGFTQIGNAGVAGYRAAITSVQTGGDSDQLGLAFLIHPSTTGGDDLSEALRITSDGNIGISESTPDSKLDILHSTTTNSNTENLIHLRTDPGAGYVSRGLFVKIGRDGVYDNSAAHYDIVGSSGNSGFHAFEVQGNEKLRITKDGSVTIGYFF